MNVEKFYSEQLKLKVTLFKVVKIKENVLHPVCGILSSNKNEQIIDIHTICMNLQSIMSCEKANPQKLDTVLFYLHIIPYVMKLQRQSGRSMCDYKWTTGRILVVISVLYLHSIHVYTLVVLFCSRFLHGIIEGNQANGTQNHSELFHTTACEPIIILKTSQFKK